MSERRDLVLHRSNLWICTGDDCAKSTHYSEKMFVKKDAALLSLSLCSCYRRFNTMEAVELAALQKMYYHYATIRPTNALVYSAIMDSLPHMQLALLETWSPREDHMGFD